MNARGNNAAHGKGDAWLTNKTRANTNRKGVHEYGLGTSRIEGQDVRFTLQTDIRHARLPQFFNGQVWLPADYPDTRFSKKMGTMLVNIDIDVLSSHPGANAYAHRLGINTPRRVVELRYFYGISPGNRALMTPSERVALRGLARRALCKMLHIIAHEYKHELSKSMFLVDAMGYVHDLNDPISWSNDPRDIKVLRQAMSTHVNNENERERIRRATAKELRDLAENYTRQRALENMYARTLGVKRVKTYVNSSVMATTFDDALARCRQAVRRAP